MNFGRRKYTVTLIAVGLCFFSQAVPAVLFEPGVGIGLEYTDNATLSPDVAVEDLITVGYVGARLFENEGSLKYDVAATFNKTSYVRDTFEDQRYISLGASADWEMIKERFNWFISDRHSQTQIIALGTNTPDNLEDRNVFNFGANIRFPISARQSFSLVPTYSQFYFESSPTNNKQYALSAAWAYQMFRLTNIGLNLSARKINYTEIDNLGLAPEGTTFTTLGFTFNVQRLRSSFAGRVGSTNVKRENGDEGSGFSGFLNWSTVLSSRSNFEALASTDLTDTSRAASITESGGDIQVTTDVIRNSIFNLAYIREDASWRTRVSARYSKVKYSDNPLDRVVRAFRIQLSHPITQLLSSGVYADYRRTKQLENDLLDEDYIVGGNLNYRFSRKLRGLFDLQYRTRESTGPSRNYDEFAVYASLVYGFGGVQRPSRAGGF